jgi:hypothetical protein
VKAKLLHKTLMLLLHCHSMRSARGPTGQDPLLGGRRLPKVWDYLPVEGPWLSMPSNPNLIE